MERNEKRKKEDNLVVYVLTREDRRTILIGKINEKKMAGNMYNFKFNKIFYCILLWRKMKREREKINLYCMYTLVKIEEQF